MAHPTRLPDAIALTIAHGRDVREQIVDFVVEYMQEHGWSPSYEEISEALGIRNRSTIFKHLHILERENRIVLGGGPRQIRVVGNIRSHQ
jgi:SOS-response transcriptional repressor LexA